MGKIEDLDDPALRLAFETMQMMAEKHRKRREAALQAVVDEDESEDARVDLRGYISVFAYYVECAFERGELDVVEDPAACFERLEELRTLVLEGRSLEDQLFIIQIDAVRLLVRVAALDRAGK